MDRYKLDENGERVERCCWPWCKGEGEIVYLGKPLCADHWCKFANADEKEDERIRRKLHMPPRETYSKERWLRDERAGGNEG